MIRRPVDQAPVRSALRTQLPLLLLLLALAGVLTAVATGEASSPEPEDPSPRASSPKTERHPMALQAEEQFFRVFNGGSRPETSLEPLMRAYAVDPDDPRTSLLLGLNHLWIAAEGDRTDARVIENLMLAERLLGRAGQLAPEDDRIPSWLTPTRLALAEIERRPETARAEWDDLWRAYEADPEFHAFTVGMLAMREDRGSELFETGLEALRSILVGDCGEDDPSCQNLPRWPHNQEGFLTFIADYELKAGNRDQAARTLQAVRSLPTYGAWPYAEEVTDRLDHLELYQGLYADDDPGNDPPSIIASFGCSACHRGGEGVR